MARGWGGGPPDIKGTLGTLLRTTLIQIASLRDMAKKELESRREWTGGRPSERKRTEVLAGLGAIIVELARAGELELDDFPEVREAIDALAEIDAELGMAPSGSGFGAAPARRPDIGVWRPNPDDYDVPGEEAAPEPAVDPVTAATTRPARRAARGAGGGIAFVSDDLDEEDLAEYMHEDDVPAEDDGEGEGGESDATPA